MPVVNKKVFPPTSDYDSDREDLRYTFIDRAGAHVKIDTGEIGLRLPTSTNIATGKAVYLTSGAVATLASNDSDDTWGVVGFVVGPEFIQCTGVVRVLAGLTPGKLYFLGTGGNISAAPPTADGSHVVRVGRALSATELLISIEHVVTL